MIKVLVVDDSAFMRKLVSDLFNTEQDFTVIDMARNGLDAIEKTKKLKPDVVTLDVEMPGMDGLAALEIIMRECPTPVLMLSSLTHSGAEATIKALSLGAVDFIAKTSGPISNLASIREEILQKTRAVAKVNVKGLRNSQNLAPVVMPLQALGKVYTEGQVVAIGTSTGGPRALQEIVTKLPASFPAGIVIVQHMPPGFTRSLAERLNSLSSIEVKEAQDGDPITPGRALIAPGDYHMTVENTTANKAIVRLNQSPPLGGHRPAVDPMMESVAAVYRDKAVGVILTGMGRDGSQGMKAIKSYHGRTVAEDQSTSVVFGMPKSAIDLGVIDRVVPLHQVAAEIVQLVAKQNQ